MLNHTDNLTENLNTITYWIYQIIPVIQIIFGTFRNFFNIILFTRHSLRNNPCSMYFLASSINNCFEIYVVNWNWQSANTNTSWCMISHFLRYSIISLTLWFIVLSSFDRFLTSSHNADTRKLSSLLLARKTIVGIILISFVIFGHIIIVIRPIKIGSTTQYTVLSSAYIIFYNILFVIVSNVLPIILMTIFGILTVFNVPPFCCVSMNNTFARVLLQQQLSVSGTAIINFTANLLSILYYTNSVIGFYIYTLTGPKLRSEFKRCIQSGLNITLAQALLHNNLHMNKYNNRRNRVHPIEHHHHHHQQQLQLAIRTSIV
ncbi:hypothetical protein I4U23_004415 [Adineta vaga]|nr:hypothetical protein I4U23_004415 [Adineta vaga]